MACFYSCNRESAPLNQSETLPGGSGVHRSGSVVPGSGSAVRVPWFGPGLRGSVP